MSVGHHYSVKRLLTPKREESLQSEIKNVTFLNRSNEASAQLDEFADLVNSVWLHQVLLLSTQQVRPARMRLVFV